MLKADVAPASRAASRMRSSSGSFKNGITGDTLTPTGMPALASFSIVRRRRSGAAARGSITRASAGSRVVMDTYTAARRSAAIGAIRSMSRSTPALLVISENGWRKSRQTSSTWRVMPSLRSAGW